MFQISASEFGTVSIRRRMQAFADEFLAMVTEGVVNGVFSVVTWPYFSVTWLEKSSGGKWMYRHCVTRAHMNLGQ